MAAAHASIVTSSLPSSMPARCSSSPKHFATNFVGSSLPRYLQKKKIGNLSLKVNSAMAVETSPAQITEEVTLPSWAMFELGEAPVYWKTMNGLPPTAGEKLRLFYNPGTKYISPNEEFGIGFNGGFNQPIMCGGEPRAMLRMDRGKADKPIYTIQICIPKHAVFLIFSFTNGVDWDGPYKMQFNVPKAWKNRPIEFFNKGLAEELSKEGACERAIFPDTSIVVTRCAMIGNLSIEGGDRCELNLVPGCTDPSSHMYNPLANVDDGSCPLDVED